jgi:hypothetical protein
MGSDKDIRGKSWKKFPNQVLAPVLMEARTAVIPLYHAGTNQYTALHCTALHCTAWTNQ